MFLAGGTAIAAGVDVATDGIDIAEDIATGDKASLAMDIAMIAAPEALEGALKGAKRIDNINADKAIKNIAEESIEGINKADNSIDELKKVDADKKIKTVTEETIKEVRQSVSVNAMVKHLRV